MIEKKSPLAFPFSLRYNDLQRKRIYLYLFLFIKSVHGSSLLSPCTNALIRELKELEPRTSLPISVERFSGGYVVFVLMDHSGSIHIAYQASTPQVCGVCKRVIPQGHSFTRHLAPNPWRSNEIIPYTACKQCAPFQKVEQSTGERSLQESASRLKFEREETVVKLPVVRATTPRPFPDADEVDTEATIRSHRYL